MALPSAQLGSLPSFGMPSNISTQVTHKQPKLWEQALMQLITQAGGQAIQQGVTNAMSPDFSDTPNTGWSKLTQGPKVSRTDQAQMRTIDAQKAEGAADRTARAQLNAADIGSREKEGLAGRTLTKEQNDLMRKFQEMMAGREAVNTVARDERLGAQDIEKLKFQSKLAQEGDVNRDTLLANNPNNVAQVRHADAQTALLTSQAAKDAKMQDMLTPKPQYNPKTGELLVDPNAPLTDPKQAQYLRALTARTKADEANAGPNVFLTEIARLLSGGGNSPSDTGVPPGPWSRPQ